MLKQWPSGKHYYTTPDGHKWTRYAPDSWKDSHGFQLCGSHAEIAEKMLKELGV